MSNENRNQSRNGDKSSEFSTQVDDSTLWKAFKSGNQEAYTLIYSRYFRVLYNYGRHLTKDELLVEDCIQELFIYLLKHRQNLAEVQSIKFYLYRSLRRRIHKTLEKDDKNAANHDLAEGYDFEIVLPHEQVLVQDQQEQERKASLVVALNALPKRQKEAVFLLFYENLSYPEVASVMMLEVKTVYNLIYNALTQLRKHVTRLILFLLCSLFCG